MTVLDEPDEVFKCANPRCGAALDVDHVTLITTVHMRRFCDVPCIAEGYEAWCDRIRREVEASQ